MRWSALQLWAETCFGQQSLAKYNRLPRTQAPTDRCYAAVCRADEGMSCTLPTDLIVKVAPRLQLLNLALNNFTVS